MFSFMYVCAPHVGSTGGRMADGCEPPCGCRVLCKSNKCSQPLSQFSSPSLFFSKKLCRGESYFLGGEGKPQGLTV